MLDRRALLVSALCAAVLPAAPALAQEKLKVVATFSILGDFVRNVAGDRVELKVLVGPNGDAHVYQPTPADARALTEARLVFVNGLRFEGWIDRLVRASGTKATIVTATKGLAALKTEEHDHGHGHGKKGHAHDHGEFDPHAWQSVANAKLYVANIRDALLAADPAGQAVYEANAAAYLARLDELEAEVRAAVGRIPQERRRIITSHDAFQYFEKAYGVEFLSPTGVSTEAEASARDVARLITQIRRQKIPAVFVENVTDPRLIKRIADETGAKVGGTLYSDALTDASGRAPTYLDMIRHNVRMLVGALAS